MSKPWVIWMVLVGCGLLIVGAMGWLTSRVLDLEEERALAEAEAEVEERVRLALSRMDTAASGVLVLENQRPPEHYQAFFGPADLFTNTFQQVSPGLVVQPSPLLSDPPEFVRLHFEVNAVRQLSSPQVPTGNQRDLAEVSGVTAEELDLAAARLESLRTLLEAGGPAGKFTKKKRTNLDHVLTACAPNVTTWNDMQTDVIEQKTDWVANQRLVEGNQVRQQAAYQQELSIVDQGQRAKVYENTLHKAALAAGKRGGGGMNFGNIQPKQEADRAEMKEARAADEETPPDRARASSQRAASGKEQPAVDRVDTAVEAEAAPVWGSAVKPFRPVWLGAELLAVRHVQSEAGQRYQGVWLDAAALKAYLLESVDDQLANADLTRVEALVGETLEGAFGAAGAGRNADPRVLVTMPWRLEVGERARTPPMAWTPLRVSLGIGWVAVVLAMIAAAALVRGVLKMGERRAAFVSSVTHELRTPLTTFQLYSDMLAEGMVRDEGRKQDYLDTLRLEAGRLNHLIENVLAYSRIERGSARTQREKLSLAALVGRIQARLSDRVARDQAQIQFVGVEECEDVTLDTDVTAVEQIVFNLVDNACKYGLPKEGDRTVRLSAENGGTLARIEVCDSGGGIARGDAKKLFRPFHKSAKDAADSKPGVGLGLALCKRLARALGGDLTLNSGRGRGACFVLELPVAGHH